MVRRRVVLTTNDYLEAAREVFRLRRVHGFRDGTYDLVIARTSDPPIRTVNRFAVVRYPKEVMHG